MSIHAPVTEDFDSRVRRLGVTDPLLIAEARGLDYAIRAENERLHRTLTRGEVTMPTLRCKMFVNEVSRSMHPDGSVHSETVKLSAVMSGSDENKEFSKWTPSAQFSIQISNPSAFGQLANGHEYYVDFTPAQS